MWSGGCLIFKIVTTVSGRVCSTSKVLSKYLKEAVSSELSWIQLEES